MIFKTNEPCAFVQNISCSKATVPHCGSHPIEVRFEELDGVWVFNIVHDGNDGGIDIFYFERKY